MIHNPQQLEKALFALKIIGIVVLEFVLYCVSPFTLVAILYQAYLRFKYGLHTCNIKNNYWVVQF